MDLEFNSYSSEEIKKMTPNRVFEQWLLDDEPAIGTMEYNSRKLLLERRERICKSTESTPVISAIFVDANLNAFHYKAIEHLLPYDSHYDSDSWWFAQYVFVFSAEVMFRGQVLQNMAISVLNSKHRNCPRGKEKLDKISPFIIKEILKKTPRAYQNCSLFGSLKGVKFSFYLESADTYCLNKTHRYPIVPFLQFKEKC